MPALAKIPEVMQGRSKQNPYLPGGPSHNRMINGDNVKEQVEATSIDQISNFVDRMRMRADGSKDRPTPIRNQPVEHHHNPDFPHRQSQNEVMDQIVVEAEQFKAAVEPPKGMLNSYDQLLQMQDLSQVVKNLIENDDDKFFHLTCHNRYHFKAKNRKG